MLRPVLGFLTFLAVLVMLADSPLTAQDKKGGKKNNHEATIIKVDTKGHSIEVDIHEKGGKKKKQHFKLAESVTIKDAQGHVIKLEVFKKGDQVKIVETEGKVHELHHKTHKGPGKSK